MKSTFKRKICIIGAGLGYSTKYAPIFGKKLPIWVCWLIATVLLPINIIASIIMYLYCRVKKIDYFEFAKGKFYDV